MFSHHISIRGLVRAAANGSIEKVVQYIKENSQAPAAINAPHIDGNTALITAAIHGQTKIVELLLHSPGINVNAANQEGNTALMMATMHGRTDIVKILLKVPGILINAVNQDGFTALMRAVIQHQKETVKDMLAADGINLEIKNIFQRTAADEAVLRGEKKIAHLIDDFLKRPHQKIESEEWAYESAMCVIA